MSTIQFEIRHENGRREAAAVDGDRALVGSAAHCDVRLPMEDAAGEQLLVEVGAEALRVEVKSAQPAVLLDGKPIESAILAAGSMLGIGRVRLLASAVTERDAGPRK